MANPFVPPAASERPSKSIRPMGIGAASGWTFLVTAIFITMLGFLFKERPGSKDDEAAAFACQAIAYLLGLFGILRLYGPDTSIREFIGMRKTSWVFFPLAILLGISTTIAADVLYTFITHRFPWDEGPLLTDVLRETSRAKRVVICVIIALLGPLIEEVFFRGAIFRPQKKASGAWVTVIVTALLFTLVHVVWQKFAPLIVLALCLGAVREWSGSIWVSWTFHATFNGVGVLSSVIELNTGKPFDIPEQYQVVATIVSVIVAAVLMFVAKVLGDRSSAAKSAQALDA